VSAVRRHCRQFHLRHVAPPLVAPYHFSRVRALDGRDAIARRIEYLDAGGKSEMRRVVVARGIFPAPGPTLTRPSMALAARRAFLFRGAARPGHGGFISGSFRSTFGHHAGPRLL
jgi:hypothetical protein